MAEISIIIVNYNVKYFLEQCLYSIRSASKGESVEVIVVDNASSDHSVEYIRDRFPNVKLIPLMTNVGFSKANNIGVQSASGDKLLFLNPDTIIPESIFKESTHFLNQNTQLGALGYRMFDGSGRYLKESKRGIPTIWASFCKFSGISTIFPSKKAFSRYYLGNLSENDTNKIDVISGAAFFIKKAVFLEMGGFDERFFMYGEDIDISIRLLQAGYNNYYLPKVSLIHFKGESSPRNKEFYIHFYASMAIFLKKHYKMTKKWPVYALIVHFLPFLSLIFWIFNLFFQKIKGNSSNIPVKTSFSRVFHPGAQISFESLIEEIIKNGPAMISASGSSSMIGSPQKTKRGIAIPI